MMNPQFRDLFLWVSLPMNRYLWPTYQRPLYLPPPIKLGDRVRITDTAWQTVTVINEVFLTNRYGIVINVRSDSLVVRLDGDDRHRIFSREGLEHE